MPGLTDPQVLLLIQELLEVQSPQRAAWLEQRFPADAELRSRLLAAMGEQQHSAVGTVDLPRALGLVVSLGEETVPAMIGRYKIVRELGRGGMGRVFLAHDEKVERHVTLKLIRNDFHNDEFFSRFEREARAAGRLRHKNIVTVFDVQEHEGCPFIVMEYIPGRTLFDVIAKREHLPLVRKLEVIQELCAGLGCAHRAGIVHRDVKPANVMIDEDGVVKVLDFGIAKPLDADGDELTLTAPHAVLGTTGYMSPEQLSGAPVDSRSDMFAAAVIAYELIAYQKPFGTIPQDISARMIRGEIAPINAFGTEVPEAVEQAILRGLAVRPADRYPSMALMERAFADARETLLAEPVVRLVAADERDRSSRVFPISLAASIVAAIVGGAIWVTWARVDRTPISTSPTSVIRSDGVVLEKETATDARPPSRSGRRVAPARSAAPPSDGASGLAAHDDSSPAVDEVPLSIPPEEPPTVPNESSDVPTSRVAVETTTPVTPTPGALVVSDEEDGAIRRALRMFEAAFQNRSTADLRKVYPALTQSQLAVWERTFLDSTSYSVDIVNERVSMTPSGRARVDCALVESSAPKRGESRRHTNVARITLEKVDGNWLISSLQSPGWQ